MIAKTKYVMKKTALALCLSAVGFLGGAGPAMAFTEGDPWFHAWQGAEWAPFLNQYTAFVSEVDDQFFAINEYLAEIYQYMTTDVGNNQGMGIIGAINANTNKIWAEARPFMENGGNQTSAWNRRNALDAAPATAIMNRMPNPLNCSELANKVSSRALGGGGGHGRAKNAAETNLAKVAAGTSSGDVASAAQIYGGHTSEYCTDQDAKYDGSAKEAFGAEHGAFGCSAKGALPDADARIQSIFTPAHDFTDTAQVGKSYALTFDAGTSDSKQSNAAEISIANLVSGFSPPALPKDISQTPGGRAYEAKVKVFNNRISPGIMALTFIKASRNSVSGWDQGASAGTSQSLYDNWTQSAGSVYKNVFPAGTPVPTKPSTAELMRFEVYRRYFDWGAESWIQKLTTGTPDQVQVQNGETLALNAYLQYQTIQLQEQNNALLTALLSQSVNPVTKNDMMASAQQASRNK